MSQTVRALACFGALFSCVLSLLASVFRTRKRDDHQLAKEATRDIFLDNGDTLPVEFNVDHRDFEEGDLISDKGKWGPVHKARWLDRDVAVKTFDARSTSLSRLLMSREAMRLLRLRHPNIVYLLEFNFLSKEDWILTSTLIIELMDCDLVGYMNSKGLHRATGIS